MAEDVRIRAYEIRSIGIWSTIKVGFFINLITGFGVGLLFAVAQMVLTSVQDQFMPIDYGFEPPPDLGAAVLLIFPFMYAAGNAVFGTILLAVLALFYNLIARLLGGVELTLSGKTGPGQPSAMPVPATPVAAASQPPDPQEASDRPAPPPPVISEPPEKDWRNFAPRERTNSEKRESTLSPGTPPRVPPSPPQSRPDVPPERPDESPDQSGEHTWPDRLAPPPPPLSGETDVDRETDSDEEARDADDWKGPR